MHQCTDPELRGLIHEYEHDRLNDADRERFEAHLFTCPFCFEEAQAMRHVAAVAVQHRDALLSVLREDGLTFDQIRRRLRMSRETVWDRLAGFFHGWQRQTALAGAIAVAVLFGLLLRPHTGVSPYQDYLSYELPPYQAGLTLRGETQDEATRLFELAMEFYVQGNYTAASKGIKHSLRLDANQPERWLYLGAAQYALRDAKGAIKSLRRAESDGSDLTRTRARWYLAQSYLVQGKVGPAEELLQSVAAQKSEHAEDARSLLTRIMERERQR